VGHLEGGKLIPAHQSQNASALLGQLISQELNIMLVCHHIPRRFGYLTVSFVVANGVSAVLGIHLR
jgi:hypothetical protein